MESWKKSRPSLSFQLFWQIHFNLHDSQFALWENKTILSYIPFKVVIMQID